MQEPLKPTVGLGVLHLFCKVRPEVDPADISSDVELAVKELGGERAHVVSAALLGHKADLVLMALGEDWDELRRFQSRVQLAGLDVVDSYVSLTEVSEYAKGMPQELLDKRLYPVLPPEGFNAFCFYPMSKRRGEQDNWYSTDYDQRLDMMLEHGKSGRGFAGRVVQLITGSTGLDDYEWGVTLFGRNPDDLKDCVYTMRFDRASARFAEFGAFYVGVIDDAASVVRRVLAP